MPWKFLGPGKFFIDGIIIDNTEGLAIQIDVDNPDYGWRDILGEITVRATGPSNPNFTTFRGGNTRAYAFGVGEEADLKFHLPHDYAPGTDLFLHLHWAHNGASISGSLVVDYSVTYAKGHNQENFIAEVNPQLTVATPDIATVPQYRHRVDEIQISAAVPAVDQIDSNDLEIDGVVCVNVTPSTIPTIGTGSPNEPFFLQLDIHYQSTGIPTKNKAPDFYV